MRCAFVVATTYQLFNAIKLLNIIKQQGYIVDLYFQNWSEQTNQLLKRIGEMGLFSNIYQWNDNNCNENTFFIKFNRFSRIMLPRLRYKNMAIMPSSLPPNDYYDLLTYTVGTDMELVLMNINRRARIIGIDDGTGSYVADQFRITGRIWTCLKGNKIFNNRNLDCLFLNNPSMCLYNPDYEIRKIPDLSSLSECEKETIYKVFDYHINENNDRFYFLTFPYCERGLNEDMVRTVDSIIYNFSGDLIVRNHPRETRERIPGIHYDDPSILWELKCDNDINDDKVLIAFCSTAQITPKMLYDKEPYLVFLYRLFDCDWIEDYDRLVEQVRNSYRNKKKVFLPSTLDELVNTLNNLLE